MCGPEVGLWKYVQSEIQGPEWADTGLDWDLATRTMEEIEGKLLGCLAATLAPEGFYWLLI